VHKAVLFLKTMCWQPQTSTDKFFRAYVNCRSARQTSRACCEPEWEVRR